MKYLVLCDEGLLGSGVITVAAAAVGCEEAERIALGLREEGRSAFVAYCISGPLHLRAGYAQRRHSSLSRWWKSLIAQWAASPFEVVSGCSRPLSKDHRIAHDGHKRKQDSPTERV